MMINGSKTKMKPGPSLSGFGKQDLHESSGLYIHIKEGSLPMHENDDEETKKDANRSEPNGLTVGKQKRISFKLPKLRAPSLNKPNQETVETSSVPEKTGQQENSEGLTSPEKPHKENGIRDEVKMHPTTPQCSGPQPERKRTRLEAVERRVKKQNDVRVKILELESRMDKLESELDLTAEIMRGTLVRATMLQTVTKTMLESAKVYAGSQVQDEQL